MLASPAVLADLAGPLAALGLLLRPTPIAPDPLPTPRSEPEQRPRPEALAQPAKVIQWTDVNVTYAGPAALRQDYQLMRVLAHQPDMDLQRSECRIDLLTRLTTGEQRAWASPIRRFVFITDLIPRSGISESRRAPAICSSPTRSPNEFYKPAAAACNSRIRTARNLASGSSASGSRASGSRASGSSATVPRRA